ncbi:unnamed protein product [Rotaria sp. Silwood1]|nr:unnamed protein product [Rotaria sp. Silwood1]CAF1027515.1 unnamed protein product [Rotaria sp. Silwood1]CAF1035399.1 unnamed protein product [Rotaria sp. Silwood1]CAF3421707.1 unnamed protein product [Rotaria sp. Silwood1]CAF3426067.1 unnamed protein product [Rotaria sp. Silwood1]
MKKLEDMSNDKQDPHTVSSLINILVDKTGVRIDLQDDDDDVINLAERIGKRSLTTSKINLESDVQQIKRLRNNTANTNVSILNTDFYCSLYQFLIIIFVILD